MQTQKKQASSVQTGLCIELKKKNLANAPELLTLYLNFVTSEIFGSQSA